MAQLDLQKAGTQIGAPVVQVGLQAAADLVSWMGLAGLRCPDQPVEPVGGQDVAESALAEASDATVPVEDKRELLRRADAFTGRCAQDGLGRVGVGGVGGASGRPAQPMSGLRGLSDLEADIELATDGYALPGQGGDLADPALRAEVDQLPDPLVGS
ncbi:MAG: hypothetical protein U9R72_17000 [Chloroflexota bacterium]|nr:hypothetical protein [Chloroflexota bacterium]